MFPVALGFVLSSKNDRSIGRALGVLAVFLLPIVIFFSQYMIALYMVIYTALVTCAFLWFGGMKRVQKRARSRWKTMLLALVIALVLFALIWVPLHYAIRNVARTLGLKSLHARAESVLLSHTNEEFRDTIWKTLSQEDGLFDDDFNEQGDAMLARSQMYSMMLNSISLSPFLGRLSDNRVIISNHSEFLHCSVRRSKFFYVIVTEI